MKENVTVAELAWLAGIIDGEGSIFVMKQKRKDRERDTNYILRVKVQSTDKIMCPSVYDITGQLGACFAHTEHRENQSNSIVWEVSGRKAAKFLNEILPYMRVKKDQAILAIKFQETTKKHWRHMEQKDYQMQEQMYQELKDMKHHEKLHEAFPTFPWQNTIQPT